VSALAAEPAPSLGAVLFDMDGLLVESESTWYAVECAVTARLGGTWTPEHQRACLGSSLPNLAAYIVRLTGATVSEAGVAQEVLDEMITRLRAQPVHWQPGAQALLTEVHAAGVPTALVSASYRPLVDAVLEGVGAQLFDVTVAGDEVGRTKPDPEPYLTAAEALGVLPRSCVVLEDSANGARAGLAAGCHTVLVPSLPSVTPPPGAVVRPTLERLNLASLSAIVAESRPPS
jgi:HAD superfamily hydrolase (TIGR01509 family)